MKLTPESQRQAGTEGTVVSRRGALLSSGSPSHATGGKEPGLDGRPSSPTQRDMVTASLAAVHHPDVYALRRIPGTDGRRHA